MNTQVYFVSGIDTDIGKTYATGFLARQWRGEGRRVVTQKLVQTGCVGISDDIVTHRRIMGVARLPEDESGLTAPQLFAYPASPHLAAAREGREFDESAADAATAELCRRYDCVLLEGAGGLMVPLKADLLAADYAAKRAYPVILVTSGRLGSINHTLLSLEALQHRGLTLHALVFNHVHDAADGVIARDTHGYLQRFVHQHFADSLWIDLPVLNQAA